MIELSQNCGSDRYAACADEIPRLNPGFYTFHPTPVDFDIFRRDFKSPTGAESWGFCLLFVG